MTIFNLPDLGEGLPDAEIMEWYIAEGDEVAIDQPLVAMETAKAVVDVPSPYKGTIKKIFGSTGDIIKTNSPLIEFELATAQGLSQEQSIKQDSGTVVGMMSTEVAYNNKNNKNNNIKATPAIRELAKRFNINLADITPTGSNNTVTKQDVITASQNLIDIGDAEPLRGARRAMSRTMAVAHHQVAAATIMDDADISLWDSDQDVTIRIIQAIIKACSVEPILNSWFNSGTQELRTVDAINLGIAVDSKDNGLFVPVIKNIEKLTATKLREEINNLKQQVKEQSFSHEQLKNNTITFSNVGVYGIKYSCPVIIPPTVAIIASGRITEQVKLVNNKVQAQKILPLSLTFDHRCITGGEASRFLAKMLAELKNKRILDESFNT